MRKLDLPPFDSDESYFLCTSTIADELKKSEFEDSSQAVLAAELNYLDAAHQCRLHLEEKTNYRLPTVTTDEMAWLYERKMATKGSAGRRIYDRIKLSTRDGMCALCGAQPVSSLDHFFPKRSFPALAVTPANLIPVCQSCNHAKGSYIAGVAIDLPVHPYFDDFNDGTWLAAQVETDSPAAVVFSVSTPDCWDTERSARINGHFNRLGLSVIYSSYASQIVQGIRYDLLTSFKAGGEPVVRDELWRKARTWEEFDRNSWQFALYAALAGSDWYCQGGFDA